MIVGMMEYSKTWKEPKTRSREAGSPESWNGPSFAYSGAAPRPYLVQALLLEAEDEKRRMRAVRNLESRSRPFFVRTGAVPRFPFGHALLQARTKEAEDEKQRSRGAASLECLHRATAFLCLDVVTRSKEVQSA